MQFFIDTGSVEEVRQAQRLGILAGVTTNPSHLAKQAGDRAFRDTIIEICELVQGPVSAEVVATSADAMVREGRELASWHQQVVVKVPITPDGEGLVAISTLARDGIRVNTTLIFNVNQALLAARAGATYVSPFVGRLDDLSQDGMQLVRDTVAIFRQHQIPTQVLAASLRHPRHVAEAALAGADVATLPLGVLLAGLAHPLTDAGLQRFQADWQQSGLTIFTPARAGD